MNILSLIDQVLGRTGEGVAGPEIEVFLPTALGRFGESVANDPRPNVRELLRKEFTIPVVSGVGDLSTALTDAEPLLASALPAANLYITAGTQPMQYLPDRVQLGLGRSNIFIYYAIEGNSLLTRNTDGSLTSLNTTITATASYVPSLANVPAQLEDEFVDLVVRAFQPAVK